VSIYTRGGDSGETSLIGRRCSKADPLVEAYGTVDELNSVIGVTITEVKNDDIKEILNDIQSMLYVLGADLSGSEKKITSQDVRDIEKIIDIYDAKLPKLTSFIRPKGWLHICRTVCRRAERRADAVRDNVNLQAIVYLNRLSDLFFVLARVSNDD
jgi:cob(I)alamin adenosyltransferase